MDFMQDVLVNGRRFRTLNVLDTVTRECLAIEVDTSLPGKRVVRLLDQLILWHGAPKQITLDNGPEFTGPSPRRLGVPASGGVGLHRSGQAHAERLPGELQWQIPRRVPECALVPQPGGRTPDYHGLEGGVQYRATAQRAQGPAHPQEVRQLINWSRVSHNAWAPTGGQVTRTAIGERLKRYWNCEEVNMCGLVGQLGEFQLMETLSSSLRTLTYRGYDSAGIAVTVGETIQRWRTLGSVDELQSALPVDSTDSRAGIAHTRWATHGRVSEENAHPLMGCSESIAVAHNGIIDNFESIRDLLIQEGHSFRSDTDSEVIVHLLEGALSSGLDNWESICSAFKRLDGRYAAVILFAGQSPTLVAIRHGLTLLLGSGNRGVTVASDLVTLKPYADEVVAFDDRQFAIISAQADIVRTLDTGSEVNPRRVAMPDFDENIHQLEGFAHFMRKEIDEQPTGHNPDSGVILRPKRLLATSTGGGAK